VVGKFCPLHRGHQLLIEFAQARCEQLVIMSYTKPEFPGCPPQERARWLEALYPTATRLVLDDQSLAVFAERTQTAARRLPRNDAPDDDHRQFVGWICRDMLRLTVDVVFTSERYGDGFAAALSHIYRAAGAPGHRVEHVCFDLDRRQTPVSGTKVRSDPENYRHELPEIVAWSFAGPPSRP
jgi:hypothetical protein